MPDDRPPDWGRPVVHWAIEAVDVEAQRRFYSSLFSWEIGDGPFAPIEAASAGPSRVRPVICRPAQLPG